MKASKAPCIRVWLGMAICLPGHFLAAEPAPPAGIVERLGNESYPARMEAVGELETWVARNGEPGRLALLGLVRSENNPERRELAMGVLKELVMRDLDKKRPGFVGIRMSDVSVQLNEELVRGVLVEWVHPNSPADRSGFKQGDVILDLDGRAWGEQPAFQEFGERIAAMAVGDKVRMKVLRKPDVIEIEMVLGSRPWSLGEFGGEPVPRQGGGALRFRGELDPAFESKARDQAFADWLRQRSEAR